MEERAGARLVIVNPNAARLRDRSARRHLVRHLVEVLERKDGATPEVVETSTRAETAPAVESGLAAGVRGVVGVGGDGTLRDIATLLRGTQATLGVVPGGTGNQLASALGIPRQPRRAVDALAGARARCIDLGEASIGLSDGSTSGTIFTIGCGIGFDARLMATTPPSWKRRLGTAAYFVQALRLARSIDVQPYRIHIDGRSIETAASVAIIGNLGQLVPGYLGTRLPLVPDDARLDLIVVGAQGPLHGLRGLADQVLRTSLGGGPGSGSLRLRGQHVIVETERPEAIEIDGDHVGEGQLEARVLPAALQVLVPAG